MNEALVLREYERRRRVPKADVRKHLFIQQRLVAEDRETQIACLCTRRAGKSEAAGVIAIDAAQEHPGSLVPYIALTRFSAKNIIWPILVKLNQRYQLGAEMLEGSLTMRLRNGSQIFLIGADTANFIERLRGPKYPIAIIDEAQAFRDHLRTLIDDVLLPAVSDYDGRIYMFGTPGVRLAGVFYDATTGKEPGWSVHKWSVFDNPHMPGIREFLRKLMEKKRWTKDNPTYRREWNGEWVIDLDALVYKFRGGKNEYDQLPDDLDWFNILAIDYGWHDKTAFGIVSYSPNHPKVYVPHVEGHSEMIPSAAAGRLKQIIKTYSPVKIVADTGGLGKTITEEMIRRYHIPIHAAQKTDKLSWIELVNGDFIDGNLAVHNSLEELKHQYSTLTKNDKGLEDEALPNDLADVVLYGYREARAYAWEAKPEKPKNKAEAKRQALAREERNLEAEEEAAFQARESKEWWER
jgi:hypothetical protein